MKSNEIPNPSNLHTDTELAKFFLDSFSNAVDYALDDDKKDKLIQKMVANTRDKAIVTEDEIRFRHILETIGRIGTEDLLRDLKNRNFFRAPWSLTGPYSNRGGLVAHSLFVYDYAIKLREEILKTSPELKPQLEEDSIAVAALLHDVRKADEYEINDDGIPAKTDPSRYLPLGGHADKSLIIILKCGYRLMLDEILAIKWHLGTDDILDPEDKAIYEIACTHPLCGLISQVIHDLKDNPNA